jgi:hypothetical protein
MECSRRTRILAAVGVLLVAPLVGACSDEDGDGATSDEEITDISETVDSAEDQVGEEVDGMEEGSNEDGE